MFSAGSSFVVALDACVLYGYPVRDTLLRAIEVDLYRPAWSEEVWAEVLRNLQDPRRTRPHTPEVAQRLMAAIRRSFPSAFVTGYESLIPAMQVDPKDRHVAAMAVRASAQVLVTFNLKHFSAAALAPYGIAVQHPDTFLYNLYLRTPSLLVEIVRAQAADLVNPPMTTHALLDALEQTHIRRFAHAIRSHLS